MIAWLKTNTPFPPIETALDEPNGLLAAGADLSPRRLIDAYCKGIFPWFNEDQPILWWSPNPRMVLFVDEFRASTSLRKVIRQQHIQVRVNTCFTRVMHACAQPREPDGGTWITDSIVDAYTRLHRLGYAHSVESWQDGALVGGLYGVQMGRMFYGESMFTRVPNASKVALAFLVAACKQANMPIIDCQQETHHLAFMGARPIHRTEFVAHIAKLVQQPVRLFENMKREDITQ